MRLNKKWPKIEREIRRVASQLKDWGPIYTFITATAALVVGGINFFESLYRVDFSISIGSADVRARGFDSDKTFVDFDAKLQLVVFNHSTKPLAIISVSAFPPKNNSFWEGTTKDYRGAVPSGWSLFNQEADCNVAPRDHVFKNQTSDLDNHTPSAAIIVPPGQIQPAFVSFGQTKIAPRYNEDTQPFYGPICVEIGYLEPSDKEPAYEYLLGTQIWGSAEKLSDKETYTSPNPAHFEIFPLASFKNWLGRSG